jgi:hypothetical protein
MKLLNYLQRLGRLFKKVNSKNVKPTSMELNTAVRKNSKLVLNFRSLI